MEDKIIDRLLSISNGAMLLNGKQVAQALGLDPSTVSELKGKGMFGIPVVSGTGKREKYSVIAIAKFLLGQYQPAPAPLEHTQSLSDKPKRKRIGGGLPTCQQLRSMALKHFTNTMEEEAQKSLEVAMYLKKLIDKEELENQLSSKKLEQKIVKI